MPKIYSFELPEGTNGLLSKINIIGELINKGSQNIDIRSLSVELISGLEDFDFQSELEVIYNWVIENIRYVRDIDNIELIHDADKVLEFRAGDCDDFTILLGSMLKSIGFPIQMVIASRNGIDFEHIYLRVNLNNKWIVCDASMKMPLGEEIQTKYKRYFLIK